MKLWKSISLLALVVGVAGSSVTNAADKAADKKDAVKAKPYPLKVCIVADDKLDHDTYAFVYQGQEFKLCCESCKKDFDKAPTKFVKKLADATAKK